MQHAPTVDHADAVRAELARIVASPDFDASERNRQFLTYVVGETLADRADRIKAYSIATSVFGRDENFDPQLDSIVRIEAGRLRRSLEHYYLTSGAQSTLRIAIPRGTYVPTFISMADVDAGDDVGSVVARHRPARDRHPERKPVILVLDFGDESVDQSRFLASGLTRQIVVGLTRFAALSIFGQQTAQELRAERDLAKLRCALGVDYFVSGGVYHSGGLLHVDVILIEAESGRFLWAETFERPCDPADLLLIRDEVAANVVRTLAQPWGVLFSNLAAASEGKRMDDLTSFDAIVRYHQYGAAFDAALYPVTRATLERAVQIDRDFGEAWACLSMLQKDALRFGFRVAGDPPAPVMMKRAMESARRAVSLSPHSSLCFLALGQACWFTGDIEGGLSALSTALKLNPNDTEVMAELGQRQCMRMDWDVGVAHILAAYERNPALPPNFRVGLALWHFVHGRLFEAQSEVARMSASGIMYRHFMMAVVSHALGNTAEAREAIDAMLAIDPVYGSHVKEDLMLRGVHPDLISRLVAGLRAAGLPDMAQAAVGLA